MSPRTKNILWLDTGTSGSLKKPHVWCCAGIIDIDGVLTKRFDYKMQPLNLRGTEKLAGLGSLEMSIGRLVKLLRKYAPPFMLAGYNTGFDARVLYNAFQLAGVFNFDEFFTRTCVDVMRGFEQLVHRKVTLSKACRANRVPISAHNAASDIEATRMLYCKVFRGHEAEQFCYKELKLSGRNV